MRTFSMKVKLPNNEYREVKLEDSPSLWNIYRGGGEPTKAVMIKSKTYQPQKGFIEFWDFFGWEDVVGYRIMDD